MASFGSIQFEERGSSNRFALEQRSAVLAVTHVPGASGETIQRMGIASGIIALSILCSASTFSDLNSAVGNQATLTYSGGSGSAILETISNAQQIGRLDYFEAQATFRIPGSALTVPEPPGGAVDWSELTGLPGSFPPSVHTHSAAEIVSGTLLPERGGTGANLSATGPGYLLQDDAGQPVSVPPPGQSTVYVAVHGDDANSGLLASLPKATITGGLAAADNLLPTEDNPIAVIVEAGVYAETFTIPSYVFVMAWPATVIGQITINEYSKLFLARHYASSSNQNMLVKNGEDTVYVHIMESDGRGIDGTFVTNTNLVNQTNNAIGFFEVEKVFITQYGRGIRDFAALFGHNHFRIKDLYFAGNYAVGVDAGGASDLVGYIDHILKFGTPTNCTAIKVASGGRINLTCNDITADIAYDVAAGGCLNLTCTELNGTRTGAGRVSVMRSGSPGANAITKWVDDLTITHVDPIDVTGSRSGGAALENLLTALAGLNLITDSTEV